MLCARLPRGHPGIVWSSGVGGTLSRVWPTPLPVGVCIRIGLSRVRVGAHNCTRVSHAKTDACAGEACWAADSTGRIQLLDARTQKPQSSLKGHGGAVRSISLHPSRPLLASVGLDRHLRIHDTRTRECLTRLYMKQILTAVDFWESACSLVPQHGPDAKAGPSGHQLEPALRQAKMHRT